MVLVLRGLNPKMHGVGAVDAVDFCPLLKMSLGNPYMKILDLSKLFVANAHTKKTKYRNLVLLPLRVP